MRAVTVLAMERLDVALPFYMEFEELFIKYAKTHGLESEEFGRLAIISLCETIDFKNRMKLLKKLLSLKIPFHIPIVYGSYRLAVEVCRENGIWDAYEALNLAKLQLGDPLKKTVLREKERIEALVAFSSSFFAENELCFEKGTNDYAMVNQMTASLVDALETRRPISEDLLFLCWKWNTRITEGRPLDSLLGKSLCKTLEDILFTAPLNEFDWTWFNANLLPSAVTS